MKREMEKEYLEEALQEISDRHLEEAAEYVADGYGKMSAAEQSKRIERNETAENDRRTAKDKGNARKQQNRRGISWKPAVALAAAAAVLLTVIFGRWSVPGVEDKPFVAKAGVLYDPEYPETFLREGALTPGTEGDQNRTILTEIEYRERMRARGERARFYKTEINQFSEMTARQILGGAGENNVVYSPINLYLALTMLAEISDGNSRQQILNLLGEETIASLRAKAKDVWNGNYLDNGITTSVLASSLWLDDEFAAKQEMIDLLGENYYTYAYQGDMESSQMLDAMKTWLNDQTGGLLEEAVEDIRIDPLTIFSLATTIYFKDQWLDRFHEDNTTEGVFYSPAGEQNCQFMYRYMWPGVYCYGERFGAVELGLEGGGTMWCILPDEGTTVDELLSDDELYDFLEQGAEWEKTDRKKIHFYLPKFDVSSDMNLTEDLRELGVTDIFSRRNADFSPLTDHLPTGEYSGGAIQHTVRVTVNEEGVEAAAYVDFRRAGAPFLDEEIEFRLDRPFIFVITGVGGVPLMTGVVNQP